MKKLIFIYLLLLWQWSLAQNSTVFQDNMNIIYQNVNRTYVTTGLLLDYGLLVADVAKFDGTLQTNNYVDRPVWTGLYSSLYFMKFNSNATLSTPSAVNSLINNYLVQDGAVLSSAVISDSYLAVNNSVVNLIGLHFQYEQFKANAVSANLVYVSNNKIYDTPNRASTPYEIHNAFAIAPTTTNLQGNNHTFRLRSDLFLRNNTKTISSLQADFGDGLGMRTMGIGTDVSVSYTSDSVKTIIFKLTYADGQVLQSQTLVNLSGTTRGGSNYRYAVPPDPVIFPKNINFRVPPAQMETAHVTIATAGTDGMLDKPLIFVEGYDPQNQYNYFTFINPAVKGNLTTPVLENQYAQLLEANNYDLIFVDFDNNQDDIIKR